jgi:hypothetical protein
VYFQFIKFELPIRTSNKLSARPMCVTAWEKAVTKLRSRTSCVSIWTLIHSWYTERWAWRVQNGRIMDCPCFCPSLRFVSEIRNIVLLAVYTRNFWNTCMLVSTSPVEVYFTWSSQRALLLLLSLVPQPSLGLGLLKIRLNFLEASQQFSFLQGRVVSPTPNLHPVGPGLCIYIPQRQGGYPF